MNTNTGNHNDDNNLDCKDKNNRDYEDSKVIVRMICNTILEIISIACIVLCSIILIVSTSILTVSIQINVFVTSSKYNYRIPRVHNIILMYINSISNSIYHCFDLYKVTQTGGTIIVKLEPDNTHIHISNHYNDNTNNDKSNIIVKDSVTDIVNDIVNDIVTDNITDSETNNGSIVNKNMKNEDRDSDIEDITELMIKNKIDTTEIIDLCNSNIDSESELNDSESELNDIDKLLYYDFTEPDQISRNSE